MNALKRSKDRMLATKSVEVGEDEQVERIVDRLRDEAEIFEDSYKIDAADLIESQARQIAILTAELKEAADDISALYQSRETVFTERDRAVETLLIIENRLNGPSYKMGHDITQIVLAARLQPQDSEHSPPVTGDKM